MKRSGKSKRYSDEKTKKNRVLIQREIDLKETRLDADAWTKTHNDVANESPKSKNRRET